MERIVLGNVETEQTGQTCWYLMVRLDTLVNYWKTDHETR